MLTKPAVKIERMIPETIPPVVSIENDLPANILFPFPAIVNSLIKVKPYTRQKGIRTRKVPMIETINDGDSPGFKNTREIKSISNSEMSGLRENIRFIFFISFSKDFPAIEAPIAEPMSHDPKNEPDISSYPPVMFIISLISKSWIDELT